MTVVSLVALFGFAYAVAWGYWTMSRAASFYPGEFMHSYLTQMLLQDPHRPDLGFASFFTIVARIPTNLLRETGHAAQLLSNIPRVSYRWGSPLIITTLCLSLVGLWKEFKRANPLAAWYTVCYMGILAIWPFDEHQRFVFPLFPLLLLFVGYAIGSITRLILRSSVDSVRRVGLAIGGTGLVVWFIEIRYMLPQLPLQDWMNGMGWAALILVCLVPRRIQQKGLVLIKRSPSTWMWVLIFLFAITYSAMGAQAISRQVTKNLSPDTTGMRHSPTMNAARWLVHNASTGDIVMAQWADGLHFNTGRLVIPFPVTNDPDRLRMAVMLTHPRFLVVNDPQEYPYFLPEEVDRLKILMQLFPDQLFLRHQYPGGRIFEFRERQGTFR